MTANSKSKKKNEQQLFELQKIIPLTKNQAEVFEQYENKKNLILHGYAGTGKSFISLYLGLRDILTKNSLYDKVVIIRSVVPSRSMGFLPGDMEEKARVYEEPYKEICDNLFGRGDGYEILKMRNLIKFTTSSYLRGVTFNNSIVIIDEIQNMEFQELDTIITRMGNTSRFIFCGDYRQSDLEYGKKQGLIDFLKIVKYMKSISQIEFSIEDIVRSGVVKEYIIAKTETNSP